MKKLQADTDLLKSTVCASISPNSEQLSEMAVRQTFSRVNHERIQAVESTFGRSEKPLQIPGRILVGEGRLLKFCRRGPKPKVFFLFNDVLVYGSIIVPGRWNKKKHIIPLDEVQQEDLKDGEDMANQWLIRTPRKSFYVAAASPEEKEAWMEHIDRYKALHLQNKGHTIDRTAKRNLAAAWIPDTASDICMRCSDRFTIANWRHHCRRCGFVVCGACSKDRALLLNISSRPVRVCWHCTDDLEDQDEQEKRQRSDKAKNFKRKSLEDLRPSLESSSKEDLEQDSDYQVPTK
ncbi:pleckstrin homology domain-containing family F member 2-like [Paramisgurnus dabryanus]|uniref:pleckstrin homology domain-containing family F member 2-like n=1 Tax=Paramisgurnus dabryanus TaxID=90735 RepID=UPI0031F3B89D